MATEVNHRVSVGASPMTLKHVREFMVLTAEFSDDTIVNGASKLEAVYGDVIRR